MEQTNRGIRLDRGANAQETALSVKGEIPDAVSALQMHVRQLHGAIGMPLRDDEGGARRLDPLELARGSGEHHGVIAGKRCESEAKLRPVTIRVDGMLCKR